MRMKQYLVASVAQIGSNPATTVSDSVLATALELHVRVKQSMVDVKSSAL